MGKQRGLSLKKSKIVLIAFSMLATFAAAENSNLFNRLKRKAEALKEAAINLEQMNQHFMEKVNGIQPENLEQKIKSVIPEQKLDEYVNTGKKVLSEVMSNNNVHEESKKLVAPQ